MTMTKNQLKTHNSMAKYQLLVNGYGLDGSAHTLTDEEVQTILSFKEKEGHKTLDEMYMDLPEILEDYDHYMTNYWVTTTAIDSERLHFVLVDEQENVVWDVKQDEMDRFMENFEYPENADDHIKEIDAYPHEGKENILLVYETVKGTMFGFNIESDEQPKPSDFAVTGQSMETPNYEEQLIDKVFFKGQELERNYDEEHFWGKSLTVELFTMDDLDSDDDWDDDEEE
jgi:hypothetical protein